MALQTVNRNFQTILAHESAQDFLAYLNRPNWFKAHFESIFNSHRQRTQGQIFLAREPATNAVIGSIYCELTPMHQSYGKQIPIFGWLQANSPEICAALLNIAKEWVADHGYHILRGPINVPSLYGGWGVRTKGFDRNSLVNSAENDRQLASWIARAGWEVETEYISVLATEWDPGDCPFPHMELKTYPIPEILANPPLLEKLQAFVQENFVTRLPDTTGDNKMIRMFALLQTLDQGEDFYILAFDTDTGDIIAAILDIPNIMDQWQGQPITSADIDTAIIGKKYRNANTFPWIYLRLFQKLYDRGVTYQIGATIWSKNIPALTCFAKGSIHVARFEVYQQQF
ncbi:hypothetical protein [Candidatus Lokiarchaeum ossiferum]|uniref:hypothetical protein n=1 Tax=Candidatus Lokiarchaeum ossiferum TaxID=2951803 RepID=UPI00352C9F37